MTATANGPIKPGPCSQGPGISLGRSATTGRRCLMELAGIEQMLEPIEYQVEAKLELHAVVVAGL